MESIGTWYCFDLAVRLARVFELPFTVLTRQVDEARRELDGTAATVRSVHPAQLPRELHPGDIGLCLYAPTFSRVATAPTRFAGYLATGMSCPATPGLGDAEVLVEEEGVGVAVRDEHNDALAEAAGELRRLAADPEVRARCCAIARDRFSLAAGVAHYDALYARLAVD